MIKRKMMQARIFKHGSDIIKAKEYAVEIAKKEGLAYINGYVYWIYLLPSFFVVIFANLLLWYVIQSKYFSFLFFMQIWPSGHFGRCWRWRIRMHGSSGKNWCSGNSNWWRRFNSWMLRRNQIFKPWHRSHCKKYIKV